MKKNKSKKATDWLITEKLLNFRTPNNPKFSTAKWVQFCRTLLKEDNLTMRLYEARSTVSKYITIYYKDKKFIVRFSDHRPNAHKEMNKHCDFFVGMNNFSTHTTDDALKAVRNWKASLDDMAHLKPSPMQSDLINNLDPKIKPTQKTCFFKKLFFFK